MLQKILQNAILPALALLGAKYDTMGARLMLLAIVLQESGGTTRDQADAGHMLGPALGLAQFEVNGVAAVLRHPSVAQAARALCQRRGVIASPSAAWAAMLTDDVLALGFARLLLYTDRAPLPEPGAVRVAWDYYQRNWRPGRPRPSDWPTNYARAYALMQGEGSHAG